MSDLGYLTDDDNDSSVDTLWLLFLGFVGTDYGEKWLVYNK